MNTPLARAVRKAGSQSAFGRLIGRSQSTVNDWLRKSRPLPAEYCLQVEQQLGIPRHKMRPDIFTVDHGISPLPVTSSNRGIAQNGLPVACNRLSVSQRDRVPA